MVGFCQYGLGEFRAVKEGVDAGRTVIGAGGAIAPGSARECPYNAHVRIVSGSVVPDGSQGWLPGPGASHRARALPDHVSYHRPEMAQRV